MRLDADKTKRLRDFDLDDPKKCENSNKKDDITLWPKITLGNIFEYILSLREFNYEYIGKYKDQKAYSYFDSNFVGEITINKPRYDVTVLFSNVRASMSVNEEKELWIAARPDGHVLTAWCSCMAGSGQCCNHVSATLYKVEYANSHDFISPSFTSMPCGWNKSTKTATEPKRLLISL